MSTAIDQAAVSVAREVADRLLELLAALRGAQHVERRAAVLVERAVLTTTASAEDVEAALAAEQRAQDAADQVHQQLHTALLELRYPASDPTRRG